MGSKKYLDSIECSGHPLDIAFHPKRDHLVAAALVDGTLEVHDIRDPGKNGEKAEEHDSIISSLELHTQLVPDKNRKTNKKKPASCRSVEFSTDNDGQRIYTGGSTGDFCAVNAERACTFSTTSSKDNNNVLWRVDNATEGTFNPLVVVRPFQNSSLVATGDDCGGVRIWDERILGQSQQPQAKFLNSTKRPQGCVLSWKENDDYISGLEHSDDGNTLLATSADGRLAVFDLRMARNPTIPNKKNNYQKPFRLSDDQEDELLSLKIMKNGKKVVCGTQQGVLSVFSWGTWGDCSDRFPGHPSSIDALLKVDEDTLLTGSSDGWIRVVQIHPDKFVGVLGNNDHGGFPIERLGFNANRDIVGSVSHDNFVRLWDARVLQDGYDNDQEEEDKKNMAVSSKFPKPVANQGSDDDWEDDEDSDGDSDDSSDDEEDSDKVLTVNDKRKKRLKTENERFFEDL